MKAVEAPDENFTAGTESRGQGFCDTGWYPNFTSEGHAVRMGRTKTVNCFS